jgi:hypothetical protein
MSIDLKEKIIELSWQSASREAVSKASGLAWQGKRPTRAVQVGASFCGTGQRDFLRASSESDLDKIKCHRFQPEHHLENVGCLCFLLYAKHWHKNHQNSIPPTSTKHPHSIVPMVSGWCFEYERAKGFLVWIPMFDGISLCIVWRTMYFRIFGGAVFFLIPASLLFGLLCCSAFPAFALFLLLCFSASLVFYFFFFSSFSASLLLSLLSFCVSVFCFSCFAFLLLCLSTPTFFLQSCVFAAPLPAPLLPASLFLIFLLHPVCILNETLE